MNCKTNIADYYNLCKNDHMNKQWDIKAKIDKDQTKDLTTQIIEQLLKNRGIVNVKEIELFLNPPLPDRYTYLDLGIPKSEMDKAIKRIKQAKDNQQTVIIYGDYDADGVTSTTILWESLYRLGIKVLPFLPNREEHGYGIKPIGIDSIIEEHQHIDLIITVDNGIVAFEGIEYANKLGIDVIVCDHHQAEHASDKTKKKINSKYPPAIATIHSTDTAGAGVAYYFAKAIKKAFLQTTDDDHDQIAAIGCITDMMPMKGISRSLVKWGLKNLHKTQRFGLQAILAEAKIDKDQELNTYHIGYIIGPRINASGRLGSSMDALRLICTKNRDRAMKLAIDLGDINNSRKEMTFAGIDEAVKQFENLDKKENIIISSSSKYNPGIIGLIAGRLVEKYYRPAIVISEFNSVAKGSVRSISGINIIDILRLNSDLFIDLGGHPLAAGFSIDPQNISELNSRLIQYFATNIDPKVFVPRIDIDLELDLNMLTMDLYQKIEQLNPFGMANPKPIFVAKNVQITSVQWVGREQQHLRLNFADTKLVGIYFNAPQKLNILKSSDLIDIIYQLDLNNFNGSNFLQLLIKGIVKNKNNNL